MEVVLSDVFKKKYGSSSGPNTLLLTQFQEMWRFIEETCWNEDLMNEVPGPAAGFKGSELKVLNLAVQLKAYPRDE